jgi:hypothetical protein
MSETFKLVQLLNQPYVIVPGSFNPKGAYSAGTDYQPGDSVSYLGSSYVMYVDAGAGTLPTDTTKWQLLAAGGAAGSGITRTVTVTSGSYTVGTTVSVDYVYLIAGLHTGTMPAAAASTNRYTFKNNHTADVTVSRAGTDTFEGGGTSITIAPEDSVDVISNGTSTWYVV